MGLDVLKIILLYGIREDLLGMLNLLGKGYISKEPFEKIIELCIRYSRGSSRTNKRDKLERDVFNIVQNSSNGGATLTLCVFCPRCRKKHPLKECPLDKVEV